MNILATPPLGNPPVLSELPPNDGNYYGLGYFIGSATSATTPTVVTTTYDFSSPVVDPVIHVLMMAPAEVRVTGTTPGGVVVTPASLVKLAGNANTTSSGNLISSTTGGGGTCANITPGCGSFRVSGAFSRLTLTVSNPSTATTDGFVVAVSVPIDYGDAPASYGDATHTIHADTSQQYYLGTTRPDAETATQSNATATGDDVNGVDDEDGVASFAALQMGMTSYSASVVARAPSTGAGTLVGWVDFNRNGQFDAAERASAAVPAGNTGAVTLTWSGISVPTAGTTYTRFRTSIATNIGTATATGTVADGEVEDYALTISPSTIALNKVTEAVAGGSFGFTLTNTTQTSGSITTTAADAPQQVDGDTGTGGTQAFAVSSAANPVTITEGTLPAGWQLSNATCVNAASTTVGSRSGTTYTLSAAEMGASTGFVCTLTNRRVTDLSVTKTNTPANGNLDQAVDVVISGSTTTYTIRVNNGGAAAVANAVVKDTALSGLSNCQVVAGSCTTIGTATCPTAANLTFANLISGAGVQIPSIGAGSGIAFQVSCSVD